MGDSLVPVTQALQEAVNTTQAGGLVTKYVGIVEVMTDHGKCLHIVRGPSTDACSIWDIKGMLAHAIDEAEFDDYGPPDEDEDE